jgi:hypothetical protein
MPKKCSTGLIILKNRTSQTEELDGDNVDVQLVDLALGRSCHRHAECSDEIECPNLFSRFVQ